MRRLRWLWWSAMAAYVRYGDLRNMSTYIHFVWCDNADAEVQRVAWNLASSLCKSGDFRTIYASNQASPSKRGTATKNQPNERNQHTLKQKVCCHFAWSVVDITILKLPSSRYGTAVSNRHFRGSATKPIFESRISYSMNKIDMVAKKSKRGHVICSFGGTNQHSSRSELLNTVLIASKQFAHPISIENIVNIWIQKVP